MKIICIIIGFVCLYYDILAIQKPDHMRTTLQEIVQTQQHDGNIRQ